MYDSMRNCSDRDMAEGFLKSVDKEVLMQEIFRFFGFDCLVRCNIDSGKLDLLIEAFEQSGSQDTEGLAEVIALIRRGKLSSEKKEEDQELSDCKCGQGRSVQVGNLYERQGNDAIGSLSHSV